MEKIIEITKGNANQIEVIRLNDSEEKDGFQRPLKTKRIASMVESFANGFVCPPIMIAQVEGRKIVYDGQHRLESWKESNGKFRLQGHVKTMTMKEARENFIKTNSSMIRVGLKHRLSVDPSEFGIRTRALAKEFGTDVQAVYNLLTGVTVGRARRQSVTRKEWALAKRILAVWTADKRWSRRDTVYPKLGTLRLIGSLCREKSNPEKFLRTMQRLDYGLKSAYAKQYGGSNEALSRMRAIIFKLLFSLSDKK